jgi:hypothetical protein
MSRRSTRRAERRANAPQRRENRRNFINKAKKLVKKAILAPAKAAQFAVLIPFRPAMEKMLKTRGVNPAKKFSEVIKQFHDTVLKKNFENQISNADEYGVIFDSQENLVDDVAGGIITAILEFFKRIKDKKKNGEKLTPEEEKIAAAAENIDTAVREAARDGIEETIGEKLTSPTGLIVVGGLAVGGIYLATR